MKVKVLIASVLGAFALSTGAFAQVSGVTILPVGGTAEDTLTITLNPGAICPDTIVNFGGSLASATVVRLHSGYINDANAPWNGVVAADLGSEAITGFTLQTNGTWTKRIHPRSYYNVPAGTAINGMSFVLNGGVAGEPNGQWTREGKVCAADASGNPAAGDAGNFIVTFPLSGQIAGEPVSANTRVAKFLSAAQPNPFVGSTSVKFNVEGTQNVVAKVMNAVGAEIAIIANGSMSGAQTITWNGNTTSGAKAAKGLYFITITMGNKVDTKSVIKLD